LPLPQRRARVGPVPLEPRVEALVVGADQVDVLLRHRPRSIALRRYSGLIGERGKSGRASVSARLYLFLRSNVLGLVAIFIALSGAGAAASSTGGDPQPAKSSVKKQVKKLKKRVSALEAESGTVPSPPNGPAGGDLNGSYPDPSLRAPEQPILAGLPDANSSCASLPTNKWYDSNPNAFNEAGYYRDRQGRVYLQGEVLECGAAGGPVFTPSPRS